MPQYLEIGSESFLTKVAAFDLDNTLIRTKSGKVLPTNYDDWCLRLNVFEKLQSLKNKYKIVIITNQSESKDVTLLTTKIKNIIEALKIPDIKCLVSIGSGHIYRKPCTGLWSLLKYKQIEGSFYVGDAAGRQATASRKKDFSGSDYKFALNLGIKFYLPETFFKTTDANIDIIPIFNESRNGPFDILKDEVFDFNVIKCSDAQEVLVLIGPQGSGKSTFSEKFVECFKNYVIVSKDTFKTKSDSMFSKYWSEGRSIILDNTNSTKEVRSKMTSSLKIDKQNIRAVFFDLPKQIVFHLNAYRSLTSDKHIPEIAIHKYYKHLERPTDSEFSEIFIVKNIVIDVNNKLLNSYLPEPRGSSSDL